MAFIRTLFTIVFFMPTAYATHHFTTNDDENQILTASIIEKVLDQTYFAIDHFVFNCRINGHPKSCLVQFARMQLARKNNARAFSAHLREHKSVLACVQAEVVTLDGLGDSRYFLKIKDYKAKKNELILQITFHDPLPESQTAKTSSVLKEPPLRISPLPANFGLSIYIPADKNTFQVIATVMHLVERIGAPKDKWEVLVTPENTQQKTFFDSIFSSKGLENFKVVEACKPSYSHIALCHPGFGHLNDPVLPTLEAFEKYEGIAVTGHCHRPMAFGESLEIIEDQSPSTTPTGWLAFDASLYVKEEAERKNSTDTIIQMTTSYCSPTILYIENYNQ